LTTLVSSYLLSKYGLYGTIRLIWEGDHLPPEIRNALDTLDTIAENRIPKLGRKLDVIDCTVQLAKLNSVDNDDVDTDSTPNATTTTVTSESDVITTETAAITNTTTTESPPKPKKHYILSQIPKISKDLSTLSYNLDKVAAEVDAIKSHGDTKVKLKKKAISTLLVTMMEQVDGFMSECGVP